MKSGEARVENGVGQDINGVRVLVQLSDFSFHFSSTASEETFAYDSSLFGLLDAIVGTYKILCILLPSFIIGPSFFIHLLLLWRLFFLTASMAVEGGA